MGNQSNNCSVVFTLFKVTFLGKWDECGERPFLWPLTQSASRHVLSVLSAIQYCRRCFLSRDAVCCLLLFSIPLGWRCHKAAVKVTDGSRRRSFLDTWSRCRIGLHAVKQRRAVLRGWELHVSLLSSCSCNRRSQPILQLQMHQWKRQFRQVVLRFTAATFGGGTFYRPFSVCATQKLMSIFIKFAELA